MCFFSSCIVVVPEGTSPRRRPRSRAIACVRAIRERVRDETILSAERDARGARGALGAPTRVRFFVTRARRDPSTSSRPPRSDARVVSEIRGQIFDCLRFPSIVFDRPRAPPVDEGPPPVFFIFLSYSYYFPAVARARGLFDRGRGFDTSPASRRLPRGGNADSLPGISRATRTRVRDDESTRNADARRGRLVYVYPRIRSSSDRASRARSEIIDRSIDRRSTRALERERFDANRTTRARVRRVSTWRTRKI